MERFETIAVRIAFYSQLDSTEKFIIHFFPSYVKIEIYPKYRAEVTWSVEFVTQERNMYFLQKDVTMDGALIVIKT